MTDVTTTTFETSSETTANAAPTRFIVKEKHWGYIVKSNSKPKVLLVALQAVSLVFGALLGGAAIVLLTFPGLFTNEIDFAFRAVLGIIFASIGFYLLWYATRGFVIELQVDMSRGEIRERVRNRAGRSTRLGNYGFDAVSSVFIDRSDMRGDIATLMLRFQDSTQIVPVAWGTVSDLEPLRERLAQDLILSVES